MVPVVYTLLDDLTKRLRRGRAAHTPSVVHAGPAVRDPEYGGLHHFHVEHFRPHSIKRFLGLKTAYTNLLYACGICNKRKGNDWPSDDPLTDGRGYLDPCEHDYEYHFCAAATLAYHVEGLTSVAKYMVHQLRLNRRQLLRIRQWREEKQRRHEDTMHQLETAISSVKNAITRQGQNVSQEWLDMYASLIAERDALKLEWDQRWVPEFEADDYR